MKNSEEDEYEQEKKKIKMKMLDILKEKKVFYLLNWKYKIKLITFLIVER